ncbi:MAG: helix-turn-helix transcriptional regulator [Muribaculaceae bacterium]|nr:helix-turn-helix transcriptional regulator [Muribaculaceae bacterium]
MKSTERNSIIEICPIRNVVARFGDKWSLLVLLVINDKKTVRFNELARMIPDISTRMLSGTLKTLEADGLINRKVYPQVPPKVEYTLTDTGKSLIPLINQLTEWALKNMKRVMKHRADYDMAHN